MVDIGEASPSTPAGAHAPPARRRGLWALPLVLSLAFVAGVVLWAEHTEREERLEERHTMISDTLSLEAQLHGRLDVEAAHLRTLATHLRKMPHDTPALAALPEVVRGLRRLWISVTWLDPNNRIIAHVPDLAPGNPALGGDGQPDDASGMSAHLVAPITDSPATPEAAVDLTQQAVTGAKVVVRYSPALLLRTGTPWWITQKYRVRLIDTSEQVIATIDDGPARSAMPTPDSYRAAFGSHMPGVYLELTLRTATQPWWHALPAVLVAGFLLLIGGATWLLRRQVRQVSRAEVAWRTEAAWRSAMEDSALVGLRARDADGRLLYVNRTFCDMVGMTASDLIGRVPPMPYWPPDSIEDAMMRSRRSLAGLAPREGYEVRWRHMDGHMIDVMVFESPLVDAAGQQIGWMGSITDITLRKRLEERERHQAEAMAHQARLTTLGEIASALAHQLNQPLTAITSYNGGVVRLLERSGYDNPVVLQALQRQGEQAAEAGRIVRRIREFLTRRAPQREPCDLEAVLRRAVDLLRRDLSRLKVPVEWSIAPDLPRVTADTVLIEQVVINLVRNALDEMAGSGLQGGTVRISAAPAGQRHVRVDVDDNGPGLQGRTIEQLTTAFYSTKTEGMGMGLAICRSVIEAHHGAIDASTSPLGGARFSFTLLRLEPLSP